MPPPTENTHQFPTCQRTGRTAPGHRCWRCGVCLPIHQAALYDYLKEWFWDDVVRDHIRAPHGVHRRLRLITLRYHQGAAYQHIRADTRRLLRYLAHQGAANPLRAYLGVYAPSRHGGLHAHVVGVFTKGTAVNCGHLPRGRSIASVVANALRHRREFQVRRGHRFALSTDFRSAHAWAELTHATVGHIEYVAAQDVPHNMPPGTRPYFYSTRPAGLPTFAAYRTSWAQAHGVADLPANLADVHTRCAGWPMALLHGLRLENVARGPRGLPLLPLPRLGPQSDPPPPHTYPRGSVPVPPPPPYIEPAPAPEWFTRLLG